MVLKSWEKTGKTSKILHLMVGKWVLHWWSQCIDPKHERCDQAKYVPLEDQDMHHVMVFWQRMFWAISETLVPTSHLAGKFLPGKFLLPCTLQWNAFWVLRPSIWISPFWRLKRRQGKPFCTRTSDWRILKILKGMLSMPCSYPVRTESKEIKPWQPSQRQVQSMRSTRFLMRNHRRPPSNAAPMLGCTL